MLDFHWIFDCRRVTVWKHKQYLLAALSNPTHVNPNPIPKHINTKYPQDVHPTYLKSMFYHRFAGWKKDQKRPELWLNQPKNSPAMTPQRSGRSHDPCSPQGWSHGRAVTPSGAWLLAPGRPISRRDHCLARFPLWNVESHKNTNL